MHHLLHAAVRDAFSPSSRIVAVEPYRPGSMPYPARVTLETAGGNRWACVLKASADVARIAREARVLSALGDLGFPAPAVLTGPLAIEHGNQSSAALLLTELPGRPLPWLGLTDLADADRACRLVGEAVDAMQALTPRMCAHPVAGSLPSVTLGSELQAIVARGGPWFAVPLFVEAAELLRATLAPLASPLVFSNGDYNPLNFLHGGDRVTGWVDFEAARFEDPSIGFAKFILWADDDFGWGAGGKAGLVERYLYAHDVAPAAFLPRLILRGLSQVQGRDPDQPPRYMLRVIEGAVARLRRAIG